MKKTVVSLLALLLSAVLLCACGGGASSVSDDAPPPASDGGTKGELRDELSVGDSIAFGSYEQDGNTGNGKEPIRWVVLAMEEGRMLLLSESVLAAMPYHTDTAATTWETSSLRAWMKNSFAPVAFSETEAASILSVKLENPDNEKQGTDGGKDTEDKLFLLSFREAEAYLTTPALRRAKPTAYALTRSVWVQETGYAPSWLRSPGGTADRAMILHEGGVGAFGEFADSATVGVRPAMWVSYQK